MQTERKITTIDDVPIIDLEKFMQAEDKTATDVMELCNKVVDSLHRFGILIVRDPRAKEEENDQYIDLMERYFESRGKQLYAGETVEEFKPEYHF
jgi:molybdopterin biosynthesis enzyme MoaB